MGAIDDNRLAVKHEIICKSEIRLLTDADRNRAVGLNEQHFGSAEILIRVLLLMLVWLAVPAVVRAQDYIFTNLNGAITVTGYTGTVGVVTIPSRLGGLPVTTIGEHAFDGCSRLTSVTLPDSVTQIDGYAFQNCPNLTNVAFGNNVTSIGLRAFATCSSLASLRIPNSVTNIGEAALRGCTRLTNVSLGESITSVSDSAFRECTLLSDVRIGSSVTNIGNSAFADCTSLTSITLPTGLTSVGSGAFSWCASLTNLTVPDAVATIGDDAVRGCARLQKITIGSSVTNIGDRLSGCQGLTRIIVDARNPVYSSAEGVLFDKGRATLIRCPEGKTGSYRVPDTVTRIGDKAFADCTRLTNITISSSVTNIGAQAFSWCTGLRSITIPDAVTSLGEDALRGCNALTEVSIGSGVTNIAPRFSACHGLAKIVVGARNAVYSSVDGVLFNKSRTTLIQCPEGRSGSYTVPGGVTRLADNAFADCTRLTNISLPDSVTIIGNRAFGYCAHLTGMTIPDGATSLGEDALRGCSALVDVSIGSSVTNVGRKLSGCDSLARITVDTRNTVYSSVDGALLDKNQTTLIQCPEAKAGSYVIPEGVSRLGENAFAGCTSLSNITIAESVTNIGARAFSWCAGLTSITIPANVTGIEDRAFESCSRLTTVCCRGDAPKVGADIFSYADKVTIYYLPGTKGWEPTFGGRSTTVWDRPGPSQTQAPRSSATIPAGGTYPRACLLRGARNGLPPAIL